MNVQKIREKINANILWVDIDVRLLIEGKKNDSNGIGIQHNGNRACNKGTFYNLNKQKMEKKTQTTK